MDLLSLWEFVPVCFSTDLRTLQPASLGMSTRLYEAGAPLDYSFSDITSLEDLLEEAPRSGLRKPDAMHDQYGNQITEQEQAAARAKKEAVEQARQAAEEEVEFSIEEKVVAAPTMVARPAKVTTILKVNNNSIVSCMGLLDVLNVILWDPGKLTMVDLSFNGIKNISEELCNLPNLQLLYLHANEIKKLTAVKDMYNIPTLRGLTLHGNEVEEVLGYRQFVVTYLPQLMSLDFTRITEKERTDARHIVDRHGLFKGNAPPKNP